MPILLAALITVAAVLVIVGLSIPLFARDPLHSRLQQFSDRPRSLEELELEQPFSERVLRPLVQKLAAATQRMNRGQSARDQERQTSSVQHRLNLSGNPYRWTPTDFLGVKALVGLILGGFFFLILTAAGQAVFAILLALAGGALGFFAPDIHLNQLAAKRQKDIQRGLPDALDLLSICVEAGLGFDAAITRMCEKSDTPLTREFARMLQEVRVGRPRREALREIVIRTEVPDLANFISAVIQADQLGVSVTQVLEVQSEQMRTVRRQRAEEQAAQAPLKMLFPMLIFIFPALCIVILGPLWPQMANAPRG